MVSPNKRMSVEENVEKRVSLAFLFVEYKVVQEIRLSLCWFDHSLWTYPSYCRKSLQLANTCINACHKISPNMFFQTSAYP
jgi:hypothetical protein